MTTNQHHESTDTERQDRVDGRYQGQGWYLEDEVRSELLKKGYWPRTRIKIWGKEVDVPAVRDDGLSPRPEDVPSCAPPRVLVSCVDWFDKNQITPSRLWRLIAIAFSVRAEPVLVHNHRTQLTDPAQKIAEQWRVRVVTDKDVEDGTILPAPEAPEIGYNAIWSDPLGREVEMSYMRQPDYSLPDSARRRDREERI